MSLNKSDGKNNGIGLLHVGKCKTVERINNLLAILLNIIATVLVSASNYVMQCPCSPSRNDIDQAHATRSYLNVGNHSFHNLFQKVSWKLFLWLSLVLTTVPIHLLLNSAFLGALQANNYGVLVVASGWETDKPGFRRGKTFKGDKIDTFANVVEIINGSAGLPLADKFAQTMWQQSADNKLQRLSINECFERYSSQLQSAASSVVVVTKQTTGKYRTTPETVSNLNGVDQTGYLDPFRAFEMPDGVGAFINPFSGNAALLLDAEKGWGSGILPQNASGGLFLWPGSHTDNIPTLRSVFSAFDYHYWMIAKELRYDFNNPKILRAGQWTPMSWICNATDVLNGMPCESQPTTPVPDESWKGGCESLADRPQRLCPTKTGYLKAPIPWSITPQNFEVDYCLSQNTIEQCSLHFSFIILLIVIGCDVAKIFAMCGAFSIASDPLLATLGDAVASFLESPDAHTKGQCLMQQIDARHFDDTSVCGLQSLKLGARPRRQNLGNIVTEGLGSRPIIWEQKLTRWYSTPSTSSWAAFGLFYTALLAGSFVLLGLGSRNLRQIGIRDVLSQGFGSINANTIFKLPAAFSTKYDHQTSSVVQTKPSQTLLAAAIIANSPQVLFSILYFMYNDLFTNMATAAEWAQFATLQKALRVSKPKRGQRSTYWLQLPWKYRIPLLALSMLLHFVVSRSLYVVRIDVFGWDGKRQPDRDITACGYSPLATLFVIFVVVFALIAMLVVGRRKISPGMPVCGTNSLAIAAACHYSDNGDMEVSRKPLLWGVTRAAMKDIPGHCSFSDGDVGKPVDGMAYA
ncbi:MAG: hypothetical protein Q9160_006048 [Pyrenula sp. 1 TL-2023]